MNIICYFFKTMRNDVYLTAVLGERLKEASMINKSLLCLGHVINALVDRESGRERHIPFRDSKVS